MDIQQLHRGLEASELDDLVSVGLDQLRLISHRMSTRPISTLFDWRPMVKKRQRENPVFETNYNGSALSLARY